MVEEIANQQDLHVRKVQSIMDQAAAGVLVCGYGIILAAFILGSSTHSFINIPSVLIVISGTIPANMVALPLATKLERNSAEEPLVSNIYVMGPTSIRHQENPRRLEMLLNSILPPSEPVRYFD